ncbi:MAG: HEPN domain-containing protein [Chromatiaceae bacterium]
MFGVSGRVTTAGGRRESIPEALLPRNRRWLTERLDEAELRKRPYRSGAAVRGDKARRTLEEARVVLAIGLSEPAGRAAYLAAMHAAQALIFHRTGRVAKTHSGVRSEFARLTKDDPAIGGGLSTFLAEAYVLKQIAD